jgi:hypothetical protein
MVGMVWWGGCVCVSLCSIVCPDLTPRLYARMLVCMYACMLVCIPSRSSPPPALGWGRSARCSFPFIPVWSCVFVCVCACFSRSRVSRRPQSGNPLSKKPYATAFLPLSSSVLVNLMRWGLWASIQHGILPHDETLSCLTEFNRNLRNVRLFSGRNYRSNSLKERRIRSFRELDRYSSEELPPKQLRTRTWDHAQNLHRAPSHTVLVIGYSLQFGIS